MLQSDWPRLFQSKTQQANFSRKFGFCKKMESINFFQFQFQFQPYLAEANDLIFHKSRKALFLAMPGTFEFKQ